LIQGCRFEEAALSRGNLMEVEWRILRVLLPVERKPGKQGRGRPPADNRNIINGILWRLRTGAPWRDVPEKYGKWNSIYRRFRAVSGRAWLSLSPRRWPRAGITTSTALRFAPMSRQRAERGVHQRALGRSRGGFTSKIHCLGDARGRPIAFDLTPGEAADCKSYDTLIDLLERTPDALVADKAYDSDAMQRGIRAVFPPKSNRTKTIWSAVKNPISDGFELGG
jgi:transposase